MSPHIRIEIVVHAKLNEESSDRETLHMQHWMSHQDFLAEFSASREAFGFRANFMVEQIASKLKQMHSVEYRCEAYNGTCGEHFRVDSSVPASAIACPRCGAGVPRIVPSEPEPETGGETACHQIDRPPVPEIRYGKYFIKVEDGVEREVDRFAFYNEERAHREQGRLTSITHLANGKLLTVTRS